MITSQWIIPLMVPLRNETVNMILFEIIPIQVLVPISSIQPYTRHIFFLFQGSESRIIELDGLVKTLTSERDAERLQKEQFIKDKQQVKMFCCYNVILDILNRRSSCYKCRKGGTDSECFCYNHYG